MMHADSSVVAQRVTLDPTHWTRRHAAFAIVGAGIVAYVAVLEVRRSVMPGEVSRSALAAAIGWTMIFLAATIRGADLRGFLLGAVVAAATTASFSGHSSVSVAIYALGGVLFLVMTGTSWPIRTALRMGSAWMRLPFWFFGVVGALLSGQLDVGGRRVLYAALNAAVILVVIALTKRSRSDVSLGIIAAFLVLLGLLFLDGATNAFDTIHPIPSRRSGLGAEDRFWGGPHLFYSPNSMGLLGLLAAIRIGTDRSFELWQRITTLGCFVVVLLITDSRMIMVCAGVAGVVYATLAGRQMLSRSRHRIVLGIAPLVLLVALVALAGGQQFFTRGSDDPSSGRAATWEQMLEEFRSASPTEKLLGNDDTTRGTIFRSAGSGQVIGTPTDNSVLGALRRGGILGLGAFVFGFALLVWHAILAFRAAAMGPVGEHGPALLTWFPVLAIATLPTVLVSDWYLARVGHLSLVVLAGEAAFLARGRTTWRTVRPSDARP